MIKWIRYADGILNSEKIIRITTVPEKDEDNNITFKAIAHMRDGDRYEVYVSDHVKNAQTQEDANRRLAAWMHSSSF